MTCPIDETSFCERWLSAFDDPDDGDRGLALATVQAINRAYHAGLEAGRRETAGRPQEGGLVERLEKES